MLQVQTFLLPAEQDQANEFLQAHKPVGNINFNRDMIVVFYNAGDITPELEADEWREYLYNAIRHKQDVEIALHVARAEQADLNPKHNKGRYDQLANDIIQLQREIDTIELKLDFVRSRIAALTAPKHDGQ